MSCDTYFMGHLGCGIRWKHSFVRLTKIVIKVRSRSGQKVKSPNTKLSFWIIPILFRFASGFQKWHFYVQRLEMPKNGISINIKNSVPALLRNPCVQVKFFFIAGCADGTESNDIETTGIASVVCELWIMATFRTELDHCAVPLYGILPSWQSV